MIHPHSNDVFDSSSDRYDVLCQLSLMCQQENRWYKKLNYIRRAQQHQDNLTGTSHHKVLDIDEYSRTQMMTWCYEVADFCHLNHTTVEMAINYMDRFMMTSQGHDALYDRNLYQLVCMTSFYTIAKVHESTCMGPELLRALSHNLYTEDQFISMESVMLNAVKWNVNSPSTTMYIDLLLKLTPTSVIPIEHRELIHKHATNQAECLLRDATLLSTKSSEIAYCSLMIFLQGLYKVNNRISTELALAVGIHSVTDEIRLIHKHWNGRADALLPLQRQQQFNPQESSPSLSATKTKSCYCLSPNNVLVSLA